MKREQRSGWAPEPPAEQDITDASIPVPGDDGLDTPIGELLQRVVTEGRAYAETEFARQRLRAHIVGTAGRDAALLVLAAIFLLFGAMTALVVACVWILAPYLGVAGALAVTIAGALLCIIALLAAARARMRRALHIALGKEGDA